MKRLIQRFSVLAVLLVLGAVLHLTPAAGASPQYCGKGTFPCGDLSKNGACCWSDSQKCCWVHPDKGSCYCVLSTDRCNRY